MQRFARLAGVLWAPRRTLAQVIHQSQGGVLEVLAFMAVAWFATHPLEVGAILLSAPLGLGPLIAKLVNSFTDFVLGPLGATLAVGLLIAFGMRLLGRAIPIDGLIAAATYLWVPVGVLGMLGALLAGFGWSFQVLPHIRWQEFTGRDPGLGLWLARLVASYGWSAALAVGLWRAVRHPPEAPAPAGKLQLLAFLGYTLVALAASGVAIWSQRDQIRPLLPGDPAPAFRLAGENVSAGGVFNLDALKKPLVIEFWATWCGVCMGFMPTLDRWASNHPEVPVLAIHQGGTPREVDLARQKLGLRALQVLLDADESVTRLFRVDMLPTLVVIDRQGILRAIHVGSTDPAWIDAALAPG